MMAGVQSTLSNHDFKNWMKAGLSLTFTRDGIESFVLSTVDQFHKDVLKTLPSGVTCQNCTTENILPCPTQGTCSGRGPCRYHDAINPQTKSSPCPASVCDKVAKQILVKHRYKVGKRAGKLDYIGPSWVNTDARKWNTNSWEIAKCFMAPGYTSIKSATDTDLPGLLSVVINHTDFQNVVSADLTSTKNIFRHVRDIRNTILHSAVMQTTDAELSSYIGSLKHMLSDPLCLAKDTQAQQAINKLTQIENGSLTITAQDEDVVRAAALMAIRDKAESAIQAVQAEGQQQVQKAKEHVQTEYNNSVKLLNANSKQSVDELKKQTEHSVERIESFTKQEQENAVQYIRQEAETEASSAVTRIKYITEEAVVTQTHILKETDQELKQGFRRDLIEFYSDDRLTIPINPRKEIETADIGDLYVKPCMRRVDPHNKSSKDGKPIKSYEDIFKKDEKVCKKIYITGKAGMGKSTLCQHLVATWCRAHSENTGPMTKDEESMRKVMFLFYITLRDVSGSHNHVDEMIKEMLLNRLDDSYRNILSHVLQTEQCLIILDGLDEWTPTHGSNSYSYANKGLPDRKIRTKCSIITTSRPWKLEFLRLKASEIDQHIELTGLDNQSSGELIQKAVTVLNTKYECSRPAKDFEKKIKESNVAELACIPVILKQLVCLWHAGNHIGSSKCSIYSGMINLLIQLANDKNLKGNREYIKMKEEYASSEIQFPKCFDGNKECEELKPFIYALAKLSFKTLFSHHSETSLVFDRSTAEVHGIDRHFS